MKIIPFIKKNRLLMISIFSVFIIILGFSYNQYHIILNEQNEVKKTLLSLTHTTHNAVKIWADEKLRSAQALTQTPYFLQQASYLILNNNKAAHKRIQNFFKPVLKTNQYYAYFVLDQNNNILSSNLKSIVLKYQSINNASYFFNQLRSGQPALSLPTKITQATSLKQKGTLMFIGIPIQTKQNKIIGTLLLCFDPKMDFLSLFNHARIGSTSETYAFNRTGKLITESRFDKNAMLTQDLRVPNYPSTQPGSLTEMAQSATQGLNYLSLRGYKSYLGYYVVGAWVWDHELQFGIASEIKRSEAYQLLYRNTMIYSVTAIFSFVLLLGIILLFMNNRREIIQVNESLEVKIAHRTKELSRKNALLENLALIDALTEIPNRRQFEKRLIEEHKRGSRSQTPLTLIMIDIDFFKKINDTAGHTYGDHCLQQVAMALKNILHRETDFVARFGGEEFVFLLPNTDSKSARLIAQMLMDNIQDLKILSPSSPISKYLTISQGIATLIPTANDDPKKLLELADQKLYAAKNNGRNQFCL